MAENVRLSEIQRYLDAASRQQAQAQMQHTEAQNHKPTWSQMIASRIGNAVRNPVDHMKLSLRNFGEQYLPSEEDRAKQRLAMQGSVMGDWQPAMEKTMQLFGAAPMVAPIAWHGSPHLFKATKNNPLGEFDSSKIGTGEGAQAYGHGSYLADAKGTARAYKNAVPHAHQVKTFRKALPDDAGFDEVMELVGSGHFTAEQDSVLRALEADDWLGFDYPSQAISAAYLDLDSFDPSPQLRNAIDNAAHLYKVDIPDEMVPRMLDWDAPLSEQPESVRRAIDSLGDRYHRMVGEDAGPWPSNYTGGDIYKALGGSEYTSKELNEVGIPGIKYLDGNSRSAGKGTRNYVIFPGEEGALKILDRE